jgi:hypothetical protein
MTIERMLDLASMNQGNARLAADAIGEVPASAWPENGYEGLSARERHTYHQWKIRCRLVRRLFGLDAD